MRLTSPASVSYSLRPQSRAALLLLGLLIPGLWIAAKTTRIALASILAESTERPTLERALSLDPTNPEIHHRLGMVRFYGLGEMDTEEGLKHLRHAVEFNPQRALYWVDLASACESAGDRACVTSAFDRALGLSPMMPRFHWLAANYDLRRDHMDAALARFGRLLELSPGYARPTFDLCLRVLDDPRAIYEKALVASTPELKLDYADFLGARGKADFAHQVWKETVAGGASFSFPAARPYLERLMSLGRGEEAVSVWQDLRRLGAVRSPADEAQDNLIFNGSFEQTPLNAGFDWRFQEAPYPLVDSSDAGAYQGSRCLRLDFTVKRNEDCEPVYQIVPVKPSQAYALAAYVRSQDITSDSGPRLRVTGSAGVSPAQVDASACPDCLDVNTGGAVGTTPWHQVGAVFQTGPQTRFVKLSVWRPRSRTFPTEITGTFWLDDISLKERVSGVR